MKSCIKHEKISKIAQKNKYLFECLNDVKKTTQESNGIIQKMLLFL